MLDLLETWWAEKEMKPMGGRHIKGDLGPLEHPGGVLVETLKTRNLNHFRARSSQLIQRGRIFSLLIFFYKTGSHSGPKLASNLVYSSGWN